MPQVCSRRPIRDGSALVETTAVIIVFLMVLFGVLEYCRFIFLRQLMENAAREGARYGVVNTNETDNDFATDVTQVVNARMAGFSNAVTNWNVQVYHADAKGNFVDAATNAQFGQYIAVQIDCDYSPIVPALLMANQTVHITTKALMYSEAN